MDLEANGIDEGPHNKFPRSQKVEDGLFNTHGENLKNIPVCCECGARIPDFWEEFVCGDCASIFCKDCIFKHDDDMTAIYSQPSEAVCNEHRIELVLFCEETNCDVLICRYCAVGDHKGHKILPITVKSQQCSDDISKSLQANKEKLEEIKNIISRLNSKKAVFEDNVSEVRSLLRNRRDNVLKWVNEVFEDQCGTLSVKSRTVMNEFDEKTSELEKVHTELLKDVRLYSHFPSKETNESVQIITSYQFRKPLYKFEIEDYLVEFKKMAVLPPKGKSASVKCTVESLIGKTDLVINRSRFTDNRDAYATSVIYKTDKEKVHDVCYDQQSKSLYFTIHYRLGYSILRISANEIIKEFKFQTTVNPYLPLHLYLALLPNRCILLLCQKTLKLLSEDMSSYESLPNYFKNLKNVTSICSSPCLTQTYLYIYVSSDLGVIVKYNSDTNFEKKSLGLPFRPRIMRVHGNLDYIAFIGDSTPGIHLCSFNEGVILNVIGDDCCMYRCGCFLSETNFLAYDYRNRVLEMLDFANNRSTRTVTKVSCNDNAELANIWSITTCTSNSLYVCDWNGTSNTIYKMIL